MQKAYGNRATAQLLRARMQSAQPIQPKMQVGDEEYESDLEPLASWKFSVAQRTLYKYMTRDDSPEFTFQDRDEMFTFVRTLAPFYAADPTMFDGMANVDNSKLSELHAKGIETVKGGHSLERHGPQMTEQKLKDRLTTGYIDGEFAPAGEEGYATSFNTYDDYLVTQKAAQAHLVAAYNKTLTLLGTKAQDFDTELAKFDPSNRAGTAKHLIEAKKIRTDIGKAIKDLKNPVTAPADTLPVTVDIQIAGSPQPKVGDAFKMLRFFDRYKFVLNHGATLGKGQKVKDTEKASPRESIRNPKFPLNGKLSPLWDEPQLQSMGNINNTCSTFNPPDQNFSFTATPDQWKMPQHFPDNGAPGWR
ncbi:hypothetical protein CBW65_23190 [Tumebacillus avium]|uniref:Uncharacterized protein n=1 Tax=Tumebacillus avium TaxID=1903704 RepID=A0A1Y0ISH3_9BACL|nr:hypothetical protein [Tumebacillus avium]ARU63592.1 hypothetical protein CBW65_23190 [Tumebacillus avium]